MVDITGLDKAEVLASLSWVVSKRKNVPIIPYPDAQRLIALYSPNLHFGTLWVGMELNVDITGDQFSPDEFDSLYREGSGSEAIEMLRNS